MGSLQPFTRGTPELADGLQEERARGACVARQADQLLRGWVSKIDVGPARRLGLFELLRLGRAVLRLDRAEGRNRGCADCAGGAAAVLDEDGKGGRELSNVVSNFSL